MSQGDPPPAPTDRSSLQERFAPRLACFGCGPANDKGLHIRSYPRGDDVVTRYRPQPHQEAFTGVLNGGIAGTLFDCHMLWTGAYRYMIEKRLDAPPPMVTASYTVSFRRPIPTDGEIEIVARASEVKGDRVSVDATLVAGGNECATAHGTFVAVKEGHPAFHRW